LAKIDLFATSEEAASTNKAYEILKCFWMLTTNYILPETKLLVHDCQNIVAQLR
jgi:hypothetical protein